MFDGAYPPGVHGWMLDDLDDPAEPPRTCENCRHYEKRTCGYICGMLEAEFSDEELDAMTVEEYKQKFSKEKDDNCEEHEFWEE